MGGERRKLRVISPLVFSLLRREATHTLHPRLKEGRKPPPPISHRDFNLATRAPKRGGEEERKRRRRSVPHFAAITDH